MAKLRPAACYKEPKRPYTRVSKYKRASFVTGVPGSKVKKFDMGQINSDFEYEIGFKCNDHIQLRHNSLEAFRTSANRNLEKKLGKAGYHFKLKVYPHHVMRHNPTANFAGADRFSSGMSHCFGKPLGRAAIIKKGQMISFVRVNKDAIKAVKESFRIASHKLGCKYSIEIKQLK
jgi:large subunit ribosomal protein L10e